MNIDDRKRQILAAVVDENIRTGEPVGSNAVLRYLDMNVSSATIRNDMAFLEKEGYLEQPHTSAGRIPTYLGYRYYIDYLMLPKPLSSKEKHVIDELLSQQGMTADSVIDTAVNVLSDLTNLAVISKRNMPLFSVITRVEVIPAGKCLYALLIITSSGSIKNKVCRLDFDLSHEQLTFFEKFINENLYGLNVDRLTPAMLQNLAVALGSYMLLLSPLLHAIYELSEEMSKDIVNFKGEQKLLINDSLKADEVIRLLAGKEELCRLLSATTDKIHVVFGEEEESFAMANSSMIVASYQMNGELAGSFGVIGPVRVDYSKMIPHIQYISDTVTRLLSDVSFENDDKEGRDE